MNRLAGQIKGIDNAYSAIVRYPNIALRPGPDLVNQGSTAYGAGKHCCKILKSIPIIPPKILTGGYPHKSLAILGQRTRIPAWQTLLGA